VAEDVETGFRGCISLTNCYAKDNPTYGFDFCVDLTDCVAEYGGTGFYDSSRITSCEASYNTNGYLACSGVINCRAYKNTNCGFNQCKACLGLYALSHGSALASFQACSPNWTFGGSAVANTTLGGCNHYVL